MEKEDKRGKLDKALAKITSRKLFVFLLSTIFFYFQSLNAEQWIMVALAYIGSQAFLDLVIGYKKLGKKE